MVCAPLGIASIIAKGLFPRSSPESVAAEPKGAAIRSMDKFLTDLLLLFTLCLFLVLCHCLNFVEKRKGKKKKRKKNKGRERKRIDPRQPGTISINPDASGGQWMAAAAGRIKDMAEGHSFGSNQL